MTFQVPVIDLEAALAGRAPELDTVRDAIEQAGLVQVTNHGIDPGLIEEFNRRAGRLLSLPRPQKAELSSPTGHPYRGWRQWPDDFGRLELERYNVAQFDSPDDARAAGVPEEHLGLFAHPNVWPADDPGLRPVTLGYMDACRSLAGQMLGLYARALGLPDDTFALGAPPHLRLTVNDYPTWTYDAGTADGADAEADADEAKLLLLEHADDSTVTVLGQAGDYEGLQVQAPDGGWQAVPIVPGALQVLSGMLLTRWTNGRLRPGRHRVIAGGTDTRRSTAVFCYPSLDTVVAPLGPFAGPDDGRDQGVRVWDHVSRRVEDYLEEFGRPEQIAAWRDGRSYVAELDETSAGR